ncbi:hypothetical protein GCM10010413_42110 [Promicromonospora sukumoe]
MAAALVTDTGRVIGVAAEAVLPPSFPARLTAAVVVSATEVSAAATAKDERRTIRPGRAKCPAAGTAAWAP